MTLPVLLALLFNLVLALSCSVAVIWGGWPEKVGAAINVVASGLTTALRLADRTYLEPANGLVFLIDALVLLGFLLLAMRSTRFWPIWAFGFALANSLSAVAALYLPRTPLFAFHTGLGIYAYLALLAMVLGTVPRAPVPR
jgi:hypothetical protein